MLSALEADRAHVAEIDAEIMRLQHWIYALRDEQEPARHRLKSYKYPVLTLPNEIVSEIFVHFLPLYPKCPESIGVYSPTVLTKICSKWREIALATPALWRAVSVCMSGEKILLRMCRRNIPFERQLRTSNIWLGRSRCSPLSVKLITDDGQIRSAETFATVLNTQARWEHLKLSSVGDLPATGEAMPLLRYLHLKRRKSGPTIFALREAPLLRTVVIDIEEIVNVILPWTQLTSASLRTQSSTQCLRILRQTIALVHCKLDLIFDTETDQLIEIPLPCLESLVLDHPWDEPSCGGFLNCFIVPELQSLQTSNQILEPNPIESLTSFISNSGCKLQELRIAGGAPWTRPVALFAKSYEEAFSFIPKLTFGGPTESSYADVWQ
ncbi:hypothetical protein C8R47DRAFT_1199902 [Mycena vitilis]|nr:hypothetical protein C8R47DRAFT_1199902 [Mycena vitilis]